MRTRGKRDAVFDLDAAAWPSYSDDASSRPGESCSPHTRTRTTVHACTRSRAYLTRAAFASGRRSMTYLRLEMYMMGTPGTFRMRRLSSRSHVATM